MKSLSSYFDSFSTNPEFNTCLKYALFYKYVTVSTGIFTAGKCLHFLTEAKPDCPTEDKW